MAKVLTDIGSKILVFVDSNIFTYFLLEDRRYFAHVRLFFERINEGNLSAFINNIVFTEALFNFVKAKIIVSENIRGSDFIRVVKSHPKVITEVDISPVLELFGLPNLIVLDLSSEAIKGIEEIHLRYGLLSNDAYHLLTMKHYGISDIATNDSDFERVEWIKWGDL